LRHRASITRALGGGLLVAAFALAAVVVLGGGGSDYRVTALFQNASQLVKGNLVQVAGRPVGLVEDIELTDDGQARITMSIDDDGYAPLRQGTQATIRQASLSGVANRYVDLRIPGEDRAGGTIPDGGSLRADATTTAVDLDQLFATFDERTRRSLSRLVQGFDAQYAGEGRRANAALQYLDPSLSASSRLFEELGGDEPLLRRFISSSARLVTDLAAKRDRIRPLVTDLAETTQAIAAPRGALAEAVNRLPAFLRRSNTTFSNLRATLDDLDPLVADSRPAARALGPFLRELRPLASGARPTLRDLTALVSKPGAANDLLELTRSTVPLRDVASGPIRRNGEDRLGALPGSTKALREAAPQLATARPYAVDLTAWFDDFSHSGAYDALGGSSRVSTQVNLFSAVDGVLRPIPPDLRDDVFRAVASTGQRWRCPGAVERGALYKPSPDFPCDEREQPLGR
jgi:phospholipid/cholesterol/gamma-HCH transport system substrate-binding protein